MYTNFEKEKLGKTFQYYRKTKNIKWKKIMSDSYISKNTYSRMSLGYVFNNNEYYDEFIRFFNLSYIQYPKFTKWKDDFILRLDRSLEYYDLSEIEKLYYEFHEKMDNYKEYSIYEQYYLSFDYIFRYYYKNKYLNEKEIELISILIKSKYFEEKLVIYLLEVMYISNNNSIGEDRIRKNVSKMVENYNHPILKHVNALNNKCDRKLEKSLELFKELKCYWGMKNNFYRETKALNGMFMIYKNIDNKKSLDTINELERIKESYKIPKILKKSINYNIAMFYYVNKLYEEAYPIFVDNIENLDGIQDLVLLGHICSKLNKVLPNCFMNIEYGNSNYKEYIDYFRMKKLGRSDKELVDYIMSVLLYDKLAKEEYLEPLWTIFEYEMFLLLEKSRKYYNSYIEFIKFRDKVVKYA